MRKCVLTLALFISAIILGQEQILVTNSYVSGSPYLLEVPFKIQREIYGGTKIHVSYVGDWPYEAVNAFNYACKILEESMPSTFPLSFVARWQNGSNSSNSMSTIRPVFAGIGTDEEEDILRTELKAIMYDQVCGERPGNAYMEEFMDVSFDPYAHDAEITYYNGNDCIVENCDFSIDHIGQDKYDFVSMALRDMIKAMGFVFTSYPPSQIPSKLRRKNYLEREILSSEPAFSSDNLTSVFTQGTYSLEKDEQYTFYAPKTWKSGVSMNYFVPDTTNKVTTLLGYNFGIGTSIRDISSQKTIKFFRELLGWQADIPVGIESSGKFQTLPVNTSLAIPIDGIIEMEPEGTSAMVLEEPVVGFETLETSDSQGAYFNINSLGDTSDVAYSYAVRYHPNIDGDGNLRTDAWIVSLMMKDGSWDVVHEQECSLLPLEIRVENFSKNYDDAMYERTADGYLRCRITQCYCRRMGARYIPMSKSWHYVIEDIPQKAEMKKSKVMGYNGDEYLRTVRIGLINLEGTDSLVVKQHDEGFPQPYYYSVPDFRKGYVDVVVDRDFASTIQIRSYNKNGWTDSDEYVIEPVEPSGINVSFVVSQDAVRIDAWSRRHATGANLIREYTIASVDRMSIQDAICTGGKSLSSEIPISNFKTGHYMLTAIDIEGKCHSIKFTR